MVRNMELCFYHEHMNTGNTDVQNKLYCSSTIVVDDYDVLKSCRVYNNIENKFALYALKVQCHLVANVCHWLIKLQWLIGSCWHVYGQHGTKWVNRSQLNRKDLLPSWNEERERLVEKFTAIFRYIIWVSNVYQLPDRCTQGIKSGVTSYLIQPQPISYATLDQHISAIVKIWVALTFKSRIQISAWQ